MGGYRLYGYSEQTYTVQDLRSQQPVAEDSDLQRCYVLSIGISLTAIDRDCAAFVFGVKQSTNILLNVHSYL